MKAQFVLYVCAALSPIDCREVPIRATDERAARAEWCAETEKARAAGDLFTAFVVRIDHRTPRSREMVEWWCR